MPVTNHKDPTMEAIVLMICGAINARWDGVIAGYSAFDRVPTDPTLYPHLCAYRTDYRGHHLELCKGVVRYMAFSPTDLEQVPGRFRAIALAITDALRTADMSPEGSAVSTRWQIAPDQSFSGRERILGIQNGLIPFLEIEFDFHDFETL